MPRHPMLVTRMNQHGRNPHVLLIRPSEGKPCGLNWKRLKNPVAAKFQWWALRLQVLIYKSCGSGVQWQLVEIGSREGDHGAPHGAQRGFRPPAHEPQLTPSPVPMEATETPCPEVQMVWVESPVGLGWDRVQRRRSWCTTRCTTSMWTLGS